MSPYRTPPKRPSEETASARSSAARRKKKKRKANKPLLITVCVIVLLLIGTLVFGLVSAFAVDKNTVSDGVLIGGQDMSGKTRDEVVAYLSGLENPYAASAVTLDMDDSDHALTVTQESIDLRIDAEQTADAAVSYAKGNMFTALAAKFSNKDVGYVFAYDHAKLDTMLNSFAKEVGGTLVQHEVDVRETEIVVTAGKEGLGVDVASVKEQVLDAIKPAAQETVAVSKVNTNPADINVDELYETTRRDPQDAKYAIEDGEVVIADEINGREIDIESAKSLLKGFKPGSDPVTIPFIIHEASVKADDLSMSLFADSLGSFSTKYMTSNKPRANNVELAAKLINGTILLPGEEFSYNGVVGPRTAARGFQAASVYENNKMVDGLGGGICQTSSTLYAAVLYADLQVTERHEHSLEVTYAPLGMDATVAYGSLDFRFKNNTSMPIKVTASWGGGVVSVNILGTKEDKNKTVKITTETVSKTPYQTTEVEDSTLPAGQRVEDAPGFNGYVVNTYKIIYENGVEVENKFLHKSTYTMVNRVIRVGTAAANTPEPSEEPAEPANAAPSEEPTAPPETASPTPTSTATSSDDPASGTLSSGSPSPTPPEGL